MRINVFVVVRVLMGALFIVSGSEKLLGPYQNFLYVIQNYDVLPTWGEEITARVFPWAELFLGVFLALGFWLPRVLPGIMLMLAAFILVVGQALVRGLPIDECGCFGQLISFPLKGVIMMDSGLLFAAVLLFKNQDKTRLLSLDGYFDE